VKCLRLQAYKLALPASICHIYDMFHISLLDPVKSTAVSPYGFPAAPLAAYVKDDHEYFEVEDILDSCHTRN